MKFRHITTDDVDFTSYWMHLKYDNQVIKCIYLGDNEDHWLVLRAEGMPVFIHYPKDKFIRVNEDGTPYTP